MTRGAMRPSVRRGAVRPSVLRGLLIAVAIAPGLPLLLAHQALLAPLSAPLLRWFSFQCQRDPARALVLHGQVMPVCARCFGIYVGMGLGALLLRPLLAPRGLRRWMLAVSALMLLDVVSEAFALRPAWAPLRVLSGALLSYPVSAALVHAARARAAAQSP